MLTPSTAPLAPNAPELPTHLLCEVGPLTLGLEALLVREVMAMPLVTPLTQAAPLVAGALNLRGRVVPVLDLRAALELEMTPPDASDSLVVLESGEQIVAVRVDAVRDVQLLGPVQNAALGSALVSTETQGAAARAGFVAGIARQEFELVQLLDLDAIFAAALARPVANAIVARAPGLAAPTDNWRAAWFAPPPDQREKMETRARALARSLEATGASATGAQLMATAVLGGELFGFDLKWVREFAPMPALTRVPLGPPQVKGLLNLRGEILPLIDIRHALGMKATPIERENEDGNQNQNASRMEVIVVEHDEARLAIWVEGVLDVFAAQSEIAPIAAKHEAAELLQGVVPYGDTMLAVLNLPKLLGELMATGGNAS